MEIGVEVYVLHELRVSINMILVTQFFEDVQQDCEKRQITVSIASAKRTNMDSLALLLRTFFKFRV